RHQVVYEPVSFHLLAHVRVQGVIDWKPDPQAVMVRQTQRCKSLSDGPEADTFGCDVLLTLHIRRADNPPELMQGRIGELEVLQDRLKGASIAAMIERDLGKPGRIERRRVVPFRSREQIVFRDEEKLSLRVHESPDQPGTRDAIDLD